MTRGNKLLKTICRSLWGVMLGFVFYNMIIQRLNLSIIFNVTSFLIVCLILGIGNTLSVQIRCISLLVLPSLLGKAGRDIIKTLIISYIVTGPVHNLAKNGEEVVRVFKCSTKLQYNLTQAKVHLVADPLKRAFFDVKPDFGEIERTVRQVDTIVSPIRKEIEGDDATSNELVEISTISPTTHRYFTTTDAIYPTNSKNPADYEKKYYDKLRQRCKKLIERGGRSCRALFEKHFAECLASTGYVFGPMVCWPMKISYICNIERQMELFGNNCDASDQVDSGFGKQYTEMLNISESMKDYLKPATMTYTVKKPNEIVNVHEAREMSQMIMMRVQEKLLFMQGVLRIVDIIFTLLLLRVVLVSQSYHDDYLTKIDLDNTYITSYFRKIDRRRFDLGKLSVLPLKKVERKKYFSPNSPLLVLREMKQSFVQIIKLVLEVLVATIFVVFDMLVYEALDIVRKHAKMDFRDEGSFNMTLEIVGSGMMAKLVRSITREFNITRQLEYTLNNSACLPSPTLTENNYLYKIYTGYFIIFLLMIFNAYIITLHRMTCAYFYPSREKTRILHIYNVILKSHWRFIAKMKIKISEIASQRALEKKYSIIYIIEQSYPRMCGCLKYFKSTRKKCFLCEEKELRCGKKNEKTFHVCENLECKFVYCAECWLDMGCVCYACLQQGIEGSVSYFTSDMEDETIK